MGVGGATGTTKKEGANVTCDPEPSSYGFERHSWKDQTDFENKNLKILNIPSLYWNRSAGDNSHYPNIHVLSLSIHCLHISPTLHLRHVLTFNLDFSGEDNRTVSEL